MAEIRNRGWNQKSYLKSEIIVEIRNQSFEIRNQSFEIRNHVSDFSDFEISYATVEVSDPSAWFHSFHQYSGDWVQEAIYLINLHVVGICHEFTAIIWLNSLYTWHCCWFTRKFCFPSFMHSGIYIYTICMHVIQFNSTRVEKTE